MLEQFQDRGDGIRWSAVMFRWHLVRIRIAENRGDHEAAARHAADALELTCAEPQIRHHPEVGVVHADEVTAQRLRRLAGLFPTGTGTIRVGLALPDHDKQQGLLEDLSAAGVETADVWYLDPKAPGYDRAIPFLIKHLQDDTYPDSLRGGIARALATPLVTPHWRQLVEYYPKLAPGSQTREGLAVALSDAVTKEQLPDVVGILHDPQWAADRGFVLRTLTRLRASDRWALVEEFAHDPQIGAEARHMLARARSRKRAR